MTLLLPVEAIGIVEPFGQQSELVVLMGLADFAGFFSLAPLPVLPQPLALFASLPIFQRAAKQYRPPLSRSRSPFSALLHRPGAHSELLAVLVYALPSALRECGYFLLPMQLLDRSLPAFDFA